MKKHLLFFGVIAFVLTLAGCAKEIEAPEDLHEEVAGMPFELVASTVGTKTDNEGMKTVWEEGDEVAVFHAETGSTSYGTCDKFSIAAEDLEDGRFKGVLTEGLDSGKSYDWYVIYPYNKYLTNPAEEKNGYQSIWSTNARIQQGNDSMSHLCGTYFPMYGKATVANGGSVKINMNNLVSVLEINVTNSLDEDLVVTDVAFTAPEDVVGQYYISFAGSSVEYTPRNEDNVSPTAFLAVDAGAAITKGSSAKFYIGIKPFTAKAGSVLKLYVNGTEKVLTVPGDVTFTAGAIRKVNFNYNVETPPTEATVEQFLDADVSSIWYKLTGTITEITNAQYGNFNLQDETGTVYVYDTDCCQRKEQTKDSSPLWD